MFESLTYFALQQYWWIIISALGAALVFLLFVQGGQTMIYTLGKNEFERKMIINTLGRKWEFTFTTLVTFGGAFFASFPLFYSTSFGGAYWVWMLILFAFIIQAVPYEFRSKPANFLGSKTYEIFLYINGAVGTILLGTAVSTFFTGSAFSRNFMNFSKWETPWYGLEAALNIQNLALGLSVFFLARVLGILYIINSIDDIAIVSRSRKQLLFNAIPFLLFFLFFLVRLMFLDGFAYEPETMIVYMQSNKFWLNIIEMPVNTLIMLTGVVLVIWGIFAGFAGRSKNGIWFTGLGTFLTVFSLFILAGFNNTCFYPSYHDLQSSLNIRNASSSRYTLKVMSYVSLVVPVVVAYIWLAWRAINKKPIDADEMKSGSHTY
jgi:cytochrome d ubiquinol oxidase subunit II